MNALGLRRNVLEDNVKLLPGSLAREVLTVLVEGPGLDVAAIARAVEARLRPAPPTLSELRAHAEAERWPPSTASGGACKPSAECRPAAEPGSRRRSRSHVPTASVPTARR